MGSRLRLAEGDVSRIDIQKTDTILTSQDRKYELHLLPLLAELFLFLLVPVLPDFGWKIGRLIQKGIREIEQVWASDDFHLDHEQLIIPSDQPRHGMPPNLLNLVLQKALVAGQLTGVDVPTCEDLDRC